MMYIILAVVVVIIYRMFKAKSERKEWIEKYGTLPNYLKDTIRDVKISYPNNIVKRETSEEVNIICEGPSHTVMLFFSWVPTGLLLRIDYSDMLGRNVVKNIDFDPKDFNSEVLMQIMMGIFMQN